MRDRLVELLLKSDPLHERDLDDDLVDGEIEAIADHLLAEGVVVPLCKVGDTVYQTDGIRIYELEMFDISWRNNKPYYETESIDFDDTAIGRSIFLTREEAEKALAERRNDVNT